MIERASADTTPTVVMAINSARRCGETLELATALAADVGADLEVVFVEDADLLRLADLPVTREIDRISGRSRELDSRRMLRALHCEARRLRQELARIGRAGSVRSTLRVVRGHYLTEALAVSARVELTFVHSTRHPLPGEHLPSARGRSLAAGEAPGRTPLGSLEENPCGRCSMVRPQATALGGGKARRHSGVSAGGGAAGEQRRRDRKPQAPGTDRRPQGNSAVPGGGGRPPR